MKIVKMSLANMQGKMSRMEMKGVMAGSGGGSGGSGGGITCDINCKLNAKCWKGTTNSCVWSGYESDTCSCYA